MNKDKSKKDSNTDQVKSPHDGHKTDKPDKQDKQDKKKNGNKRNADKAQESAGAVTTALDAADHLKFHKDQKPNRLGKKDYDPAPVDLNGQKYLRVTDDYYNKELARLQTELIKLQEWVKAKGLKVVVIFEGRDAAGKGGVIKRITEGLNPRVCRVEALPSPTEKEATQWYFQRYAAKLPSAGEIVLFDRSWYNRAGVERVMGFCTEDEYREFLRSCPEFEKMLIRSGIILIKYWFSVSDEEQEKRFQDRIKNPTKRWKLSPMDLESRRRWVEYSQAKDEMFSYTDTKQSPWYVVNADIKKHARLNCISHLLSMVSYEDLTPEPLVLPPRQHDTGYVRPPITDQTFVPDLYGKLADKDNKEDKSDQNEK